MGAVDFATPNLLPSLFAFQHLPVEGSPVLLAIDFRTVWITILEGNKTLSHSAIYVKAYVPEMRLFSLWFYDTKEKVQ